MPFHFPPAKDCLDDQCYVELTVSYLNEIGSELEYWNTISFWSIIVVGVSGIVATVMIALQGDENRYWTRPVGIIATSLVTGITALVSSFHIAETKQELANISLEMTENVNNFQHNIPGRSDPADDNRKNYADKFRVLKSRLMLLDKGVDVTKLQSTSARKDVK